MWTALASIGVVAAIAAVFIALRSYAEAKRANDSAEEATKDR
jgi:hypothetical protein